MKAPRYELADGDGRGGPNLYAGGLDPIVVARDLVSPHAEILALAGEMAEAILLASDTGQVGEPSWDAMERIDALAEKLRPLLAKAEGGAA